ncbi:hypothetical protein ACFSVM_07100 [Paenibacillus shunpengii]|uniref:Uncharacterized protein n=1 Tax=Paenibacillus shunpengii TaxID=2054424 RepID=A0ABW5SMD6_9BACL|nr:MULTISPECIES: hypothetical protein [unclassified Paenibacillus]OMC70900.1 hypothetical protein BK126_01970 [Paenibacillus sp. FSL H7-0326]SDW12958.1 hypothetical protein SAMN05518848_101344 [Paenibacillus sp. PDC88]
MLTVHHSKQKVVTLEQKELFFLAGIIGSDRLLGIEDPFIGYLTEDIVMEWENTKEELLTKGYLTRDQDSSELIMTPTVFSRVAIAGLSSRACRFEIKKKRGAKYKGYLHCTNERVVELIPTQEEPYTYQLSDLGDVEQACKSVISKIKWGTEHTKNDIPALMFSKKRFFEIVNDSLLDEETLTGRLSEACYDVQGAAALAQTIIHQETEGELQLLVWTGEKWDSQSAAFISSSSMNWLFRMSTVGKGDWLIATPMGQGDFKDMLLEWLIQPADHEER